jgi:hypothetical protein
MSREVLDSFLSFIVNLLRSMLTQFVVLYWGQVSVCFAFNFKRITATKWANNLIKGQTNDNYQDWVSMIVSKLYPFMRVR